MRTSHPKILAIDVMKWFYNKKYTISPTIYFFVFFLASWAAPSWGQVPANDIFHSNKNRQFSELGALNISSDGKWSSVQLYTENGEDTLKVISTLKDRLFTFPNSYMGTFSSDGRWFAFIEKWKGFGLLDLQTESIRYIKEGTSFKFSDDGKTVGIGIKSKISKFQKNLLIYRLDKKDSLLFKSVLDYKFSSNSTDLIYISDEKGAAILKIMSLKDWVTSEISNSGTTYKHLVWDESGDSFFFMENDSILNRVTIGDSLKVERQLLRGQEFQEMKAGVFQPFFSKDSRRIFFYMNKERGRDIPLDTFPHVQIWKGTDKMIFPRANRIGEPEEWQMLYIWEPNTGRIERVSDGQKPNVVIAPNCDYALRYNLLEYAPEYFQFPTVDMYLKNLKTGEEKLLIKKQQTGIGNVQFSPSGRHLCFFNGKDWINYEFRSEKAINLTEDLNSYFYKVDADTPEPLMPYGLVGWTSNDEGVIVYDAYDLWYLSFDGKEQRKITNGRPLKKIYRVSQTLEPSFSRSRFSEFNGSEIDLSKDLMLYVKRADKSMGYEILRANGEVKEFAISDSKTTKIQKAKNCDVYIYSRETGEIPPQVFVKRKKSDRLIYQSNPQFKNYAIGKRKLIAYDAGAWKNLNGILYYPDDYRPDKKYPMITKIYEIQSHGFYYYKSLGPYSRDGYNPKNFTALGYFVFEPDIKYRIGDPGISAVECVTAGVGKVLELGEVDKKRLGLIGHSYGGYETAFIIGNTDMFRAAVSGAPVTDILSYYHSIRWETGIPNMWRMEHQQWRMGKSYYEDPEGYRRNSPIEYAIDISTPLMIWEGDQDTNIDWHQSIELYLALRRLNKEVTLCLYPGEAHDLNEAENQKDLSLRIISWFDKYLK
jgi:dipeptidyl aminopeptidase/acylaminoacyl peptidase